MPKFRRSWKHLSVLLLFALLSVSVLFSLSLKLSPSWSRLLGVSSEACLVILAATGNVSWHLQVREVDPQILRDLSYWKDGIDVNYLLTAEPNRDYHVLVAILNNKLYYQTHAFSKDKLRGFNNLLQSLVKHRRSVSIYPVFSICKSDDYLDILVPNPYFGNLKRWQKEATLLLQTGQRIPWSEKIERAFWHGGCSAKTTFKNSYRLQLVQQHNYSALDVGFLRRGSFKACRSYPHVRFAPLLDKARLARFKYLVHMDGATQGTYSKTLQYLLPLNSTILKQFSPWYEFYYWRLKSGVHYIQFNRNTSNIVSAIESLKRNDGTARAIAAAGAAFFRDHLQSEHLMLYWHQLLNEYQKLFSRNAVDTISKLSEHMCSCCETLRRCSWC